MKKSELKDLLINFGDDVEYDYDLKKKKLV